MPTADIMEFMAFRMLFMTPLPDPLPLDEGLELLLPRRMVICPGRVMDAMPSPPILGPESPPLFRIMRD